MALTESVIVGACMVLRDNDIITGTHNFRGHPIGKGAKSNLFTLLKNGPHFKEGKCQKK